MKRVVLCLLLTLPLAAADSFRDLADDLIEQAQVPLGDGGVAILPFDDKTEGATNSRLGEAAAEELTTAMIRRKVRVVERSEIRKILREHELRQQGVISEGEAATMVRAIGASYLVVGTVRRSDSGATRVHARLINATDLSAISAGTITMDKNLIEKYQPAERRPNREAFTLDILAGLSFYQLQWTRRYEESIPNPVLAGYNDKYFTTEEYSSTPMHPGWNAAARFAYYPASIRGIGSKFFATLGMQYIQLSSEAGKTNYTTTKSVQYATPSTTNPATIVQNGTANWAEGAHNVGVFAVRPGIFMRLNLADDLTFFYLGPQLNLMNLQWKHPLGKESIFSWNLDLTLGLRIDLGSVGLLIEGSVPFLYAYSYSDDREGILQDSSKISLAGANVAAGFSFRL